MRKFIIDTRKGSFSIIEVECELVSAIEDPPITCIKYNEGEYRARILKPEHLHDKIEKKSADGTKVTVMVPRIYWQHGFFDSLEQAEKTLHQRIRDGLKTNKHKHNVDFSEQDIQDMIDSITIVRL